MRVDLVAAENPSASARGATKAPTATDLIEAFGADFGALARPLSVA